MVKSGRSIPLAGKLTIKHGPLENLGMDAMTMVFKVKDPAMLSQVKVGDRSTSWPTGWTAR